MQKKYFTFLLNLIDAFSATTWNGKKAAMAYFKALPGWTVEIWRFHGDEFRLWFNHNRKMW
jgi:hypothetical protein